MPHKVMRKLVHAAYWRLASGHMVTGACRPVALAELVLALVQGSRGGCLLA